VISHSPRIGEFDPRISESGWWALPPQQIAVEAVDNQLGVSSQEVGARLASYVLR
jgi:hypothetical protein